MSDRRAENDFYFAVISALGRPLSTSERRHMRTALEKGTSPKDCAKSIASEAEASERAFSFVADVEAP